MYSYNNIVAKAAPPQGALLLDALLHQRAGDASSSTTEVADAPPPVVTQLGDVDATIIDGFLTPDECGAVLAGCERVGWSFWADVGPSAVEMKDVEIRDTKEEEEEEARLPGEGGARTSLRDAAEVPDRKPTDEAAASAFRSADTIELDLPSFSTEMWRRLHPHLQKPKVAFSESMEGAADAYERDMDGEWRALGLSPNLLFARYLSGGHFAPHVDGTSIVDLNTRSLYTVLVYLNDCEDGGRTHIMRGEQCEVLTTTPSGKVVGNGTNIVHSVVPRKGRAAIFYHNVLHEGEPVADGHSKFIIRGDVLFRREPPILTAPLDLEAFQMYQAARAAEAGGNAMEAMRLFRQVRKLSPGVAELYQL